MTSTPAPLGADQAAERGVRLPKPPGVVRQFWARHPWLTDSVIAALYFVPTFVGSIATMFTSAPPPVWITVAQLVAVAVAAAAILLLRRRHPWWLLFVAWSVCLVVYPFGTTDVLPMLLGLYALAVYGSTRAAWIGFGGSVVVATMSSYISVWADAGDTMAPFGATVSPASASQFTVLLLIATLIGVTVGNRRRYLDALIARAHDLARERDQQARLAAADERARIAREMHDIVSHGLTVMITMAEGSAAAAPRDPAQAADLMRGVAETGREALGEMRRMLGVLTDPDAPAERRPQPDAAELPDLVDGFRDAGLPVRLTTTGVPPADPALGLTVFRIVQEGLTNVLRHASGPSRVDVAVEYAAAGVDVVVEDDAPMRRGAPVTTGAGRGLTGIRERAALYGGTVEAGPRTGHGWRLHAELHTNEREQ